MSLHSSTLCGDGLTRDGQSLLVGGSQAVSTPLFEELSVSWSTTAQSLSMHVNDTSCIHTTSLTDLLQSFGYVQYVTTVTDTAGNILDLVIARSDTLAVSSRIIHSSGSRSVFNMPQSVRCRAWKRFKRDEFTLQNSSQTLISSAASHQTTW